MSDEAKLDHEANLLTVALMLVNDGEDEDGVVVSWLKDAAAYTKHLAADNARLRAEVERLTLPKLTPEEACKVLNERRHCGRSDWWAESLEDSDSLVQVADSDELFTLGPFEAIAVAEKLLRDGAASAGEGEDKSLTDAAKILSENLGRPSWLSCIGVGADSIKVMLNHEPPVGAIPSMWHGFAVETRVTGPMRLCDGGKGGAE